METNFAKLLKELYSLRQEMKEEIVTLKSNAKTRGGPLKSNFDWAH